MVCSRYEWTFWIDLIFWWCLIIRSRVSLLPLLLCCLIGHTAKSLQSWRVKTGALLEVLKFWTVQPHHHIAKLIVDSTQAVRVSGLPILLLGRTANVYIYHYLSCDVELCCLICFVKAQHFNLSWGASQPCQRWRLDLSAAGTGHFLLLARRGGSADMHYCIDIHWSMTLSTAWQFDFGVQSCSEVVRDLHDLKLGSVTERIERVANDTLFPINAST